jgi:hemerythrin
MAFYEWDNSIALGIPIIDEQHKALFGWINSLSFSSTVQAGFIAVSCCNHMTAL